LKGGIDVQEHILTDWRSMEEKTKNIKAFGIVDISVNEFRKIALVHLVDDLIL